MHSDQPPLTDISQIDSVAENGRDTVIHTKYLVLFSVILISFSAQASRTRCHPSPSNYGGEIECGKNPQAQLQQPSPSSPFDLTPHRENSSFISGETPYPFTDLTDEEEDEKNEEIDILH